MKWQEFGYSQRIAQPATISGAPRAQLELVTPALPPGRGIYGAGARIIGRS